MWQSHDSDRRFDMWFQGTNQIFVVRSRALVLSREYSAVGISIRETIKNNSATNFSHAVSAIINSLRISKLKLFLISLLFMLVRL